MASQLIGGVIAILYSIVVHRTYSVSMAAGFVIQPWTLLIF